MGVKKKKLSKKTKKVKKLSFEFSNWIKEIQVIFFSKKRACATGGHIFLVPPKTAQSGVIQVSQSEIRKKNKPLEYEKKSEKLTFEISN